MNSNVTPHPQHHQIIEMQVDAAELRVMVGVATEQVGKNEAMLIELREQVMRMDGTMLRMRADLPTKTDLNEALTNTLNQYIAKGFWAMTVLAFGALLTWIAIHLKIG